LPPRSETAPGQWRQLAERGEYVAAYAALQENPGSMKNTSADLMLAADVARWSRHSGEAAQLLERVSSQFSRDPLAPLAAFTRGRVLVENLGQPGAAASAFALSRRLAPAGSLAPDALIREIDARASVGEQNQVRTLASEYLSSYPQGRHRAKCEKLVTPD
jgi:transmembrane sensor